MDAEEVLDAKIADATGHELNVLLAEREEMAFFNWLTDLFGVHGIEVDGG